MRKIVFLNGPPGSGKDQAVKFLMRYNSGITHMKFRHPLDRGLHSTFGIPYSCDEAEAKFGVDENGRRWKDAPQGVFYGQIPRRMYQQYSTWLKQTFGDDILGKLAVGRLLTVSSPMVVFSDSGCAEEVAYVAKRAGHKNCLIIQLMREGCSFEGDTRSYVEIPGVDLIEINNRHDLFMFEMQTIKAVYTWASMPLPERLFHGD